MLITEILGIKQYALLNKNMSFASVAPYIQIAETRYIIPIIGKDMYNDLNAAVQSNTFTSLQSEVLPYVRSVLAPMALYEAFPQLNIYVSDLGVQQNKSKEDTSAPATQWAYQEARNSYLTIGSNSAEKLLEFLQATYMSYPLWANSTSYTQYNTLLLRNNVELGQYLNTQGSIRLYKAISPFIILAERKYISPIIGATKMQQLKLQKAANNVVDTELLAKVEIALAWYSLYEAIPFINVRLEANAITVAMVQDGIHATKSDDRRLLLRMAQENGTTFLADVQDYWSSQIPLPTEGHTDPYEIPDNSGSSLFSV